MSLLIDSPSRFPGRELCLALQNKSAGHSGVARIGNDLISSLNSEVGLIFHRPFQLTFKQLLCW